jgi:molybdenum cofactor cytidylyltransferase
MVSLADQPLIRPRTIGRLIDAYTASEKPFCVPVHKGKRGHPVIISPEFHQSIMALEADRGARAMLAEWPDLVLEVEVDSDEIVLDIDTAEHFIAIQERMAEVLKKRTAKDG